MSVHQIIQITLVSYTMMLKAKQDLKDEAQTVPSGLAAGGIPLKISTVIKRLVC